MERMKSFAKEDNLLNFNTKRVKTRENDDLDTIMDIEEVQEGNLHRNLKGMELTMPLNGQSKSSYNSKQHMNDIGSMHKKYNRPREDEVYAIRHIEDMHVNLVPQTSAQRRTSCKGFSNLVKDLRQNYDADLYAYLDDNQKLPIIIANNLQSEQEERLLKVLRQHRKAIGWTLVDLPRINSSICMHRILLEEEVRLVFMNDFTMYVPSFDACLESLFGVLDRCIETNPMLNFENVISCEAIVLGNLVSSRGIEVDRTKIDIIASLSHATSVREIRHYKIVRLRYST
ncbi:hypothetical protein CR513_09490, partial [Mucuna pruriens]